MSVRVTQQEPLIPMAVPVVVEHDRISQEFFTAHRATYQSLNFASPFLLLMEEAAKTTKRPHAKKEWVLQIHNGVIKKAYPDDDSLIQQIALASASSLYDQLLDFYNEKPFHYYYRFNYDASLPDHPKIPEHNKDEVASGLKRDFSNQMVEELDGTSFFAHVYAIPDDLLWQNYLDQLRPELLGLALAEVFKENDVPNLKDLYTSLAPHFFAAFQSAQEKRAQLQKPLSQQNHCCNCIIF